LNLLSFSLGSMAATVIAVPLVPRLGKHLVTIGAPLMGTGIVCTLQVVAAEGQPFPAWAAVRPMLPAGGGLPAIGVRLVDVALADVPVDDAGAASGVLTTFQQLGAAIGIAVSMTVFFAIGGDQWNGELMLDAFKASVAVAVIGLGIAAV